MPVPNPYLYLDQFMCCQRRFDFMRDRTGQASRANQHDRFEGMAKTTQSFLFSFVHAAYCRRR